jgi:uncharacterized protein YjiS (DUF1127 family)
MGFPMAYITTGTATTETGRTFFAVLKNRMTIWMDKWSRQDQCRALEALSDAELEKRGLKRADIVAYVFRDRLYL